MPRMINADRACIIHDALSNAKLAEVQDATYISVQSALNVSEWTRLGDAYRSKKKKPPINVSIPTLRAPTFLAHFAGVSELRLECRGLESLDGTCVSTGAASCVTTFSLLQARNTTQTTLTAKRLVIEDLGHYWYQQRLALCVPVTCHLMSPTAVDVLEHVVGVAELGRTHLVEARDDFG